VHFVFIFLLFLCALNTKKKPFKLTCIVFFECIWRINWKIFQLKFYVSYIFNIYGWCGILTDWMKWKYKNHSSSILVWMNEWMMHQIDYNGWIIPHWWMNFIFVLCPNATTLILMNGQITSNLFHLWNMI
jgi:hypothetical protein